MSTPELHPVAPAIGPFASAEFLEAVVGVGPDPGIFVLRTSPTGMVGFERRPELLSLAGHEDLVDYRSPRGAGSPELVEVEMAGLEPGTRYVFDSLPSEAADVFCRTLRALGLEFLEEIHAATAVLELPPTYDEYLARLSKKERHELRRKSRRYIEAIGETTFVHAAEAGELFEQFIRFHRRSPGEKGKFMTPGMESFFGELLAMPGWGIDALVDDRGAVTAAGFGYQDDDGYFLYNSAYDPDHADASPGVVLLARLIELTIERGSAIFDFLKGDEPYKQRLGARPRPLHRISGVT